MVEYRKGAENVPLREINKQMPIMVFVINLQKDDEVVEQKLLNYGDVEDRKYLGRLTFWAVTNNHSIETMSVENANGKFKND